MPLFRISGGKFVNDDGSAIAGGTLTLTLVNPVPSITPILIASGALATTTYSFSLDASGVLVAEQTVTGNSEIYPVGSYWQAQVNSTAKNIALVNTDNGSSAGSVASIATAGVANTAGNCLIAFIGGATGAVGTQSVTVTDTAGNTWTQVVGSLAEQNSNGHLFAFVAQNCKVAANNVVTATFGITTTNANIAVHQYQGIATSGAVGPAAINTSATLLSTSVVGGTIQSNRAAGVLVAGVLCGTAPSSISAGTGYVKQVDLASNNFATEDQIVSVLGSYSNTFTLGSARRWVTSLVFLKGEPSWGPQNWLIGPPVPWNGSLFPNLTVLPASSISSTLLPSDTAYTDVVQTFTAAQTFNSPVVINSTLAVCASLAVGAVSGDASASRSATTGRLWLGSDGNVYVDRSAASSVQL